MTPSLRSDTNRAFKFHELSPLLQVPLAKRGEPRPFGSPCSQGEPQGGGHPLLFFVNFGSAIGMIRVLFSGEHRVYRSL
jgi:hypothetical protein